MPHDREQFSPRLVDTREMRRLAAYQDAVDGQPLTRRDAILIDFSDCPHTVQQLVEVEGPHGVWGMMICENCGEQVAKECPHVRCDWYLNGKLLRCANCGVDGT